MFERRIQFVVSLVVLLFSYQATAAAFDKIKIFYSSVGGANSSLWIAKDAGFLAKEGIEAELIFISGSTVAASTLISGQAKIGFIGGSAPVLARLHGSDLLTVANTTTKALFSLMTTPDIQSLDDLRGKTLGVVRYGSTSDIAIRTVLKRSGIDPQKNVKIVQAGGLAEIVAAMQGKKISGGIVTPPVTFEAKKLGFRELLNPDGVGIKFSQTGVVISERYLKSDRALFQAFVRAFVRGIHFYKTQKNTSLSILKKYARMTDFDILQETYRLYALEFLAKAPYPTEESIQTILDLIKENEPKAQAAKPSEFIYPDFVQELDSSGFIDALYK